jgi:DNA-binding NarL/FixJ family response regulator
VSLTVVVVDDEPDVRALVRHQLERDGRFDVVGEAEDGEQAVRLVEQHHPDAVVLDLWMPVRSGLEALPDIVKVSKDTRVIVYTAATDGQSRREAIALGAHACVIKGGLLMADLPELVARLCGP